MGVFFCTIYLDAILMEFFLPLESALNYKATVSSGTQVGQTSAQGGCAQSFAKLSTRFPVYATRCANIDTIIYFTLD